MSNNEIVETKKISTRILIAFFIFVLFCLLRKEEHRKKAKETLQKNFKNFSLMSSGAGIVLVKSIYDAFNETEKKD
jgi:preprotein translocase subunit YajC